MTQAPAAVLSPRGIWGQPPSPAEGSALGGSETLFNLSSLGGRGREEEHADRPQTVPGFSRVGVREDKGQRWLTPPGQLSF